MKKIKICHVIGDFVNGGVESVILNYFSNINRDYYDISIIGHGIKVEQCVEKFRKLGFKIYNITPKRESFFKSYREMSEIFKKEKFDIVHAHLTEWNCIPMRIAKKNGIKVRINHSHMSEKPKGFLKKLWYNTRLWLGKKYSNYYFACGKEAALYCFGQKRINDVKIINNAISIDKFAFNEETRSKIRKELNINDDCLLLGHVGRFFEQKNHIFLIKIIKKLSVVKSNFKLLLLGDGPLMESISNEVNLCNLNDFVIMKGNVDNVFDYYQAMDIFLLTSLYEGLPVVSIEAACSGLPELLSENITHEIIDIGNIKYINICDENVDEWVSSIINTVRNNRNVSSVILNSYDIKKEAQKLDEFYKGVLSNV